MSYPDQEHIRAHDALNEAFDTGSVFTDPPEDLQRYLRAIGTINILSDEVRAKAIIRALTINHIQMVRLISSLEQRNSRTQFWFMVLAIGSIIMGSIAAAAQIVAALEGFGVFHQ